MANPQMPHIPGAAVMSDTLDFVKNLWGSMGVPGVTVPTLSVEELDKKINDLKAVEAWLNLNMSMLRGSIQALEVQRGTIATLKSVGASLAAAVQQAGGDQSGKTGDKSMFDANPYASAFFHHARAAEPAPASASARPPSPPAADDSAAQLANPAIWWNMLQDQFKQAVSTAMASETMMADAAARATETAVKFATGAAGAVQDAPAADPASKQPAAKSASTKAGKPGAGKA